MKAVILAGGYGTRLSEKTDNIPKPMVQIGGRPLLWHIMKHFSVFGVTEFVLCLGYRAEIIEEYFEGLGVRVEGPGLAARIEVPSAKCGDDHPWSVELVDTGLDTGTGGRLTKIRHLVSDDSFFMTYGDGLSDVNLDQLRQVHLSGGYQATVTAISPPSRYGFLELSDSDVIEFQEKPPTPDHIRINGGFFVLEPAALDYIQSPEQMWEQNPMKRLVVDGKLGAYRHEGFWHCIDTLRDYRAAENMWSTGSPPWKTWQ